MGPNARDMSVVDCKIACRLSYKYTLPTLGKKGRAVKEKASCCCFLDIDQSTR